MSNWYPWPDTFSRNARVNIIYSSRGIGKTYGWRKSVLREWTKTGNCFCEVLRYADQIGAVAGEYFTKLAPEFPELMFRSQSNKIYSTIFAARKPAEDEKPDWKPCGYVVALTRYLQLKNMSQGFKTVHRFMFDEFMIEPEDRYHTYLAGEFNKLASVIDSVSRETPDSEVKPQIYLCGNSADLTNPYFYHYGIREAPKHGYTWLNAEKTVLLHNYTDVEYAQAKQESTLAGQMLAGSAAGRMSAQNTFATATDDYIGQKPARARFQFGLKHKGTNYGIWLDDSEGLYYVNEQIPKGNEKPTFALTAKDNRPNLLMAKRAETALRGFTDLYYYDCIRYSSPIIREKFMDVLKLYGIH